MAADANKDNKKDTQWTSSDAGAAFAKWAIFAVVFICCFGISSWELALISDQLFCKRGKKGPKSEQAKPDSCWLPSDLGYSPYSTGIPPGALGPSVVERVEEAAEDVVDVGEAAFDIAKDVAIVATEAAVKAAEKFHKGHVAQQVDIAKRKKKVGGGRRRQRGGAPPSLTEIRRRPRAPRGMAGKAAQPPAADRKRPRTGAAANPFARLELEGWRPFDLWGQPGWPYNWAAWKNDGAETDWLYLKAWFGRSQAMAWASSRTILKGYLKSFNVLMDNKTVGRLFRFIFTLLMPIIILLAMLLSPIVSALTTIYGAFFTGLGLPGVFWAFCFTIPSILVNVHIQPFMLLAYLLIGPLFGTGKMQFDRNFSWHHEGSTAGYLLILQSITFILLLIGLLTAVIPLAKS